MKQSHLTLTQYSAMRGLLNLHRTHHFLYLVISIFTLGIGLIAWIMDAFISCNKRNEIRATFGLKPEFNFAALTAAIIVGLIVGLVTILNLTLFGTL